MNQLESQLITVKEATFEELRGSNSTWPSRMAKQCFVLSTQIHKHRNASPVWCCRALFEQLTLRARVAVFNRDGAFSQFSFPHVRAKLHRTYVYKPYSSKHGVIDFKFFMLLCKEHTYITTLGYGEVEECADFNALLVESSVLCTSLRFATLMAIIATFKQLSTGTSDVTAKKKHVAENVTDSFSFFL